MKNKRKLILKRICLFALVFAVIIGINLIFKGCPIRKIFGIPCPACGFQRALTSLFHGDFKGYMYYHPLAVPFIAAIFTAVNGDILGISKKNTDLIYILSALILFIYYCYRMFTHSIP